MPVFILEHSHSANDNQHERLSIPLILDRVSGGFPSPAAEYTEQSLDLNELCIQHPAATYFVRLEGESMIDLGMYPDDILVVDRSIQAKHGDIVIAGLYGELTCKELHTRPNVRLVPHNKLFPVLEIPEEAELELCGVVTNAVRRIHRRRLAQA